MPLPVGTITFLFTDIEGSTKLWETQPEAMRSALARHDFLLRSAIEQYDGHIFKTVGDAFCAAFSSPLQAMSAALAAQQALKTETWPEFTPLKVRIALHTGVAEARDADYFGQPLNRVARLLSAGHGGQILLTLATQELIRDTLPPDVSLEDLGAHRLRDLARSEQVFQLLHPDLLAAFPPLKSLENTLFPNNLPQQLTSFIGREKAMAEVKSLLAKTRLLTLTGSGGCGKTRLSLQVAADVLEDYSDGVWLIELAPLTDPALVPQKVAQTLGIPEEAGQTIQQTLIESLKSKHLLLLLDNCEHLITACAQLTAALLRSCPQVKALATSREALGIAGEQTYRISSLSAPDPAQIPTPQSLSQYEAVQLFLERALLVKSDFAITNQNAPALAQVCYHLDGIPLALELAAARVRSLSIEDINSKLDSRFRLLTGGDRTALPRQQTLRALIDWSYDLLNAQEKVLWQRLSVFAGGWMLSAAEQVGMGENTAGESIEDWEILDLLTSLVDKSLVIAEELEGIARYRMLETVRQYGAEKLQASGEMEPVRGSHRDYFLALTEEIKPKLGGSEQAHWLEVLEAEHDNLRLALTFCLEEGDGGAAGLRLAGALAQFWMIRGHLSEGRQHLTAILSRSIGPDYRTARANALNGSGTLALLQGDYAAAYTLHQESLALERELGDKRGIANSLNNLGNVAHDQVLQL